MRRYTLIFVLGLCAGIGVVTTHGYTHGHHGWDERVCVRKEEHEALKKKHSWVKSAVLPYLGQRVLIVGTYLRPIGAELTLIDGKREWKTDSGELVPFTMVDFWRPMPTAPIWDRTNGKLADNGELVSWN